MLLEKFVQCKELIGLHFKSHTISSSKFIQHFDLPLRRELVDFSRDLKAGKDNLLAIDEPTKAPISALFLKILNFII